MRAVVVRISRLVPGGIAALKAGFDRGCVKTVLFCERPRFITSPGGEQMQFSPEFSHSLDPKRTSSQ